MKKTLLYILAALFGLVIVLLLVGFLLFPRPDLPAPVNEDYCAQVGIRFNTNSIETIFKNPESILDNPEAFLNKDPAYQLLDESRAKGASPFRFEAWLKDIKKLDSLPQEKREQRKAYKLYQLITANQQSFCKEVGPHVLTYLPEGTDLSVTIFLTALDDPVPAYTKDGEIAFSLSHPLFRYAAILHEPTAVSTFFNLALQELYHVGYSETFKRPSFEELKENEIVIDMLIGLQNEGIATHIEHQLSEQYPSPFEWFLYILNQKTVVRWYVNGMNKLFNEAKMKPTGDAYNAIYRRIGAIGYRRKGFYIVGAYMAMTIEDELGRAALTQTILDGYESFADLYNGLVEEQMKIQWRTGP